MAVDSNGLFKRAEYAAETWNDSVGKESSAIENAMLIMNQIGGRTEEPQVEEDTEPPTGSHTLSSEIVKKGEKATLTVTGEDNIGVKQIKKPDGTTQEGKTATYEIETTGEYKFEIEDEAGNKTPYTAKVRIAVIPEGYVASSVASEDTIEDGLVIYEGDGKVDSSNHDTALTERNQYVWIPVDDINSMVMCQDCGTNGKLTYDAENNTLKCEICDDNDNTKLAGKLYATKLDENFTPDSPNTTYSGLREPAELTDETEGDASKAGIAAIKGILEEAYPDKKGTYGETYDLIKEDWLKLQQTDFDSMAKSVAKYKGFFISRYEIQEGGTSKKGQQVLNNQENSANMWYGLYNTIKEAKTQDSVKSQMIWGSQYDQVMKFIMEKTRTDGNSNTFDVKKIVEDRHRSSEPKESGNNPADLVCNIYDLEGNYHEWTAEAYNDNHRIVRSGTYERKFSASFRVGGIPWDIDGRTSSRATLYVAL